MSSKKQDLLPESYRKKHSKRNRGPSTDSPRSTLIETDDVSRSYKQQKISKMILQDEMKSSIGSHSSLINRLNTFIPQLAEANQSLSDHNRLDLDIFESISSSDSVDGEKSTDEDSGSECPKIEFNLGFIEADSHEVQSSGESSKKPALIEELSSEESPDK